ncbi:MAG: DUF4882 domain-containing protein [Candidatus Acinetobacter avistercoris]|uniref:DUF4882 family protein n=1 Tax=Acinetobacter sp. KS-LM10 TaxID=3120518 RepID=UPI001F97C2F9|nr:DUF4882 domain-containing protein [Candidatus Acinetobacter avistercoris]
MKNLMIAITTSLVSMTGWSACTYNFDATLSQIQTMSGYKAPNITLFPQNSNQKIGLTLQEGMPTGSLGDYRINIATSREFANNTIEKLTNNGTILGDKSLPSDGIIAFELSFNVPDKLSKTGQLVTFPISASGNMENGKTFMLHTLYGNNTDSTGGDYKNNFFFMFITEEGKQTELNNLQGSYVSNSTQLQKIGFYINQVSNQIGLIVNGVNHGYVYTLPSKAKNIGFMINAMYQNINTFDIDKEFSVETKTDATKISQLYPTGTKDICGNTI